MAYQPLPPVGQDDMAGSLPVVIASDQSAVPVSGTVTSNLGTLNGAATSAKQDTIIGHVDGVETLLGTIDTDTGGIATSTASIDTKTPALGQALAEASVPVILPAATIATLTPPAAITGFGTAANQTTIIGHLDGVEGLLTTIDADTGEISANIGTLSDAAATAGGTGSVSAKLRLATSQLDSIKTAVETLDNAISGSEMQVDIVSSALPTGASTLAEQQTQTTALQILDNPVVVDDAAFTPATTSVMMAGFEFDDVTPDSVNEGDAGAARMSANRNQYVQIRDNAGNERGLNIDASGQAGVVLAAETTKVIGTVRMASGGVASGSFASGSIASGAIAAGAIAAGATSIATTEDTASAAGDHLVKVAQIRLDTPVSGANTSGSGDYTQFIADSFGKTWTAGAYPEDLAHVAGEPILGNGARRIDTPATSAGTSGDWATIDSSAEGALWGTLTPTTTGGCLTFRSIDLDETEEEVKATAGNIYGYYFYNAAASVRYLKFYNATAASTTVGTTTPMRTYPIPAGAAGHVALAYPIAFSTALSVAVTTGLADNDTGAPGANEFIINIDYK